MPRNQCKKCPWKKSTNPFDIPDGYCPTKHANLKETIATPGTLNHAKMMACHEFPEGKEKVCLGWLHHQLGPGNNLRLRLAAANGQFKEDLKGKLIGEQHERFEDTLP